jgi:BTB/POZ domain
VVLSACSSFFSELFRTLEPMHPVIVIPGTSYKSVLALLTFMYSGEVNVYEEEISSLLALAETLGIKGLADFHDVSDISQFRNLSYSLFYSQNVTKTTTHPTPKSSPDSVSSPRHSSSYKDNDSSPASPISSKMSSPFDNFFPRPMNLYPPLLTQPLNFSCNRTANDFFAKFSMPPFMAASKPANSSSNDDNNNNINDSDVERKSNTEPKKNKAPDKKKIDKIAENLRSTTITTPTSSNQYLFPKSPLLMNPSPPITPGGMLMKPPAFPNHFLAESFMAKGPENLLFDSQALAMNDVKHEQEPLMEKKPPISKLYATCFICNKQLSNQYNLRVHLETHQNVR